MTDQKPTLFPNEKTFWDAAFLAALQGMTSSPNLLSLDCNEISNSAADQALSATLKRREVWEGVG